MRYLMKKKLFDIWSKMFVIDGTFTNLETKELLVFWDFDELNTGLEYTADSRNLELTRSS